MTARVDEFDVTAPEKASIAHLLSARERDDLPGDMTLCIECGHLGVGIPFYWDSANRRYFDPSRFHCHGYGYPLAPELVASRPQRCERFRPPAARGREEEGESRSAASRSLVHERLRSAIRERERQRKE